MNVVIYYDGEDEQDKRDAERAVENIESVGDLVGGWDLCIVDENDPERPDPPCRHYDNLVGTVGTKLDGNAPHASAVTCADCVEKTKGWATMLTGLPAEPLLTFEEARKQYA